MNRQKIILFAALSVALVLAWNFRDRLGIASGLARQKFVKYSVEDRLREFGDAARGRWSAHFQAAGVTNYPPQRLVFVALKQERMLEVYAGDAAKLHFIRRIPILAASGGPGPKLREGDRQVPEGIYEIELLNPNSAYHVSLRLNYPNAFDRTQAANDGRTQLGGDIMIHGRSVSVGCLALGDEAAEDVFTLAADTGLTNITVICSPADFRKSSALRPPPAAPAWTAALYQQIAAQFSALPTP